MTITTESSPSSPTRAEVLVRALEQRLHETLADATAEPFHTEAQIFGITVHDDEALLAGDDGAFSHCWIAQSEAVYDLLEGPAAALARLFDAAAVLTTGWSAPSDEPLAVAPRHHPQRRRVRLTVVVDDAGMASALRFADTPHEAVVSTAGVGLLADALHEVWSGTVPGRSLAV
jgi:hypothetical protein